MAESPLFEIEDLHVSTRPDSLSSEPGRPVLRGVSLAVDPGEFHALVGPSGSGKSALAATLLGSPDYVVTSGRILFRGDDITAWATEIRAKAGIFLAFQDPPAISGVSVLNFLRQALSTRRGIEMSVLDFRDSLTAWMERLSMDPSFIERHVNDDFTEGDKRRGEILQMAILEPDIAILDETVAALDHDALAVMARGVEAIRLERPALGTLAITKHRRLLDHLEPDHVHLLFDGRIAASGGMELAARLDSDGNDTLT